jgi:hypothetical protein
MKSLWKSYRSNAVFLSIFCFFWSLFALTNNGWDSSEGSFGAYVLAEQIVKHQDLGFETSPGYLFMMAPNSKYYLVHEIGNAVFMLPTALINLVIELVFSNWIKQENINLIQRFILSFQACTYSAITATTFFGVLRMGFTLNIVPAFLATLCMATATYFWGHSRILFDGVLCTTLLTLSFFFILKYRQSSNWVHLALCFIFLGFGFVTRIVMIFPIMASFVYLSTISRTSQIVKRLSIAALILLPFVSWQLYYNYLRTGIFYKSSVQVCCPENNALDGNLLIGIAGLLFSPGKSLFVYIPLLTLSLILFKKFYREHRKEALYISILAILWFFLHSKLRSWYGATGLGPRHFITVMPIILIPFAVYIEYVWSKLILRFLAILLLAFGFLLSIASFITSYIFRYQYANWRGMTDDTTFIWGFWNSQTVDLLKGASSNIERMVNHQPIIKFPIGASETYFYTNSTINIWPNAFIHAGMPWYVVVLIVIPLILLALLSLQTILKVNYELPS